MTVKERESVVAVYIKSKGWLDLARQTRYAD